MKFIIATHNNNKLKEIKDILNGSFELVTLSDLGYNEDIIENGNTFEENALIKAKTIYEKYHMPVIADDSGLCVDALSGRPGINSARYSGGNSDDNINKLLKELEGIKNRKAYFICVVCMYCASDNIKYFVGKCYGEIAYQKQGESGFGYDPIFIYKGTSFASLNEEEKNKVSHRGIAFKKLAEYLHNK